MSGKHKNPNHGNNEHNWEKQPTTEELEVKLPNQFRIPVAPASTDTWVDETRYENFAEWIDSQIDEVESAFASFVTANSTKRFYGR